jgi:hypothetical protein
MSQSTQAERLSFWKPHVTAWHKSRVSGKAYCRKHGLSCRALYYWNKKIKKQPAQSVELVPVPTAFSAIHQPATGSPIKVEIGDRVRLVVPDNFSANTLSRLITVLKQIDAA